MSTFSITPELLRNGRAQLRPGRIAAVVVICAAVSFSAVAFFNNNAGGWSGLFRTMLILQIAVVLIGGGIYCLQSVHREKDLNTFDYQRITRLKPVELTLGKLLGAPALAYFVGLCLMPVILLAAFEAEIPLWTLVQIYLIVLLGSITFHLLALVLSLFAPGGISTGMVLTFLVLVGMFSIDFATGSSPFGIRSLTPFFALDLIPRNFGSAAANLYGLSPLDDSLLGTPVPHFPVLLILYVTFSAFFLLALARNIKRDPSIYEIYAPWQGLIFVLYLNALTLAFFRWVVPQASPFGVRFNPIAAGRAEVGLVGMAMWLFAIYGLTLLRKREQARRRIRHYGTAASGWLAAVWPSPYLLAGVIVTGAAILAMIRAHVEEYGNWDMNVGALQIAFVALWLVRDFGYLQWMNVRRGRRPLVSAVIYLAIFYGCTNFSLAASGLFAAPTPFRAVLIPGSALTLDADKLASAGAAWFAALGILALEACLFVWLQRRELQRIAKPLAAN